ncbi:MAG: helix-turn-helix transcriptional regulator [Herpetosiphonaceae bacterium]|nr:MAG: helix-turn-helix transcriptional regulator [Herpetosiphonaceae bacterium]
MIRVLVIAPTQALRAGLRTLLQVDEGIAIAGEGASLSEVQQRWPAADVIVSVAESTAPGWFEELFDAGGVQPALLLVSDDPNVAAAVGIASLRAWGIVAMDVSAEELAAAVRAIHAGLIAGSPALLAPLLSGRPGAIAQATDTLGEPLTAREIEVLQLLAQGLANKQIAAVLGISEHTVKFHVSSIYGRLGATNRAEAVRLGALRGFIVL